MTKAVFERFRHPSMRTFLTLLVIPSVAAAGISSQALGLLVMLVLTLGIFRWLMARQAPGIVDFLFALRTRSVLLLLFAGPTLLSMLGFLVPIGSSALVPFNLPPLVRAALIVVPLYLVMRFLTALGTRMMTAGRAHPELVEFISVLFLTSAVISPGVSSTFLALLVSNGIQSLALSLLLVEVLYAIRQPT